MGKEEKLARRATDDGARWIPLYLMEMLSRRLALHHRVLGDALDEASEIPAAADLDAVKDGHVAWIIQQEQLRELEQLIQDAHAALRAERQSSREARATRKVVPIVAGDRTVSEDPGTVFLAVQAAFNAGEVPEADFDAAYEKVAAWQPATPLEFTRKALCLLGDGKLPERDITKYVTSQVSSFRGQSMAFARCCFPTIVRPAVRFQDGSPDHA